MRDPLPRPDKHSAKWLDHQAGKVGRALAALPADGAQDVRTIAVACAPGYLGLRLAGRRWADHPRLVRWLDGFAAATPAFAKTRVKS